MNIPETRKAKLRLAAQVPTVDKMVSLKFKSLRLQRWLSGKESGCQSKRHEFDPCVRKISWRRKWQPTPVFLPGKSHGQKSMSGYSPWGHKRVRQNLVTKQHQVSAMYIYHQAL